MGILDIVPVLGDIIDRVIPDPKAKAELQLQLAQLADKEAERAHEENMGQNEVNKVEAASPSLFVAGWRPFVGWSCGGALVYSTIFAPLLHLGVPDLGFLQTILLGMLGLGSMRTYEKVKGVATETLTPNPTPAPKEAGQPAAPLAKRKKFLGIF